MSLVEAYRHHVSNSTFNHAEGDLNQFHVAGDLIQSRSTGETGWSILQRSIAGDAFYNSEQRFPPPQCHPQTRTAVQNTIQAWAEDPHPAPSVMWLYGPAGTGKSAVAQTMAEKWAASHKLAAAFFFARWRVGGSTGKSLFPTIAYQLALHIPPLRKAISLAVEADPAICDKALEDQARVLILDPILALNLNASNPSLVIVDGLDECDSTIMQSRIVKITFELLANNNLPLRFLICSRPEPRIRESFESLPIEVPFRRVVLDETFDPGRDIFRYLRDRLFQIRMQRFPAYNFSWPTERDLDQLVHNASGQFIYAATVIKFVEDEYSHPIEQLRVVLMISAESTDTSPFADLDALYKFILSVNPNVSLVLRILGTYFAIPDSEGPRRHNTAFLDDILGLYTGSVRSALRGLHSLLFIPDSDQQRIRLHHASLYDFFFNPLRAGNYFLDKQKYDNELAAKCYSLILSEFENPQQNYPESVRYSIHHWVNHYHPTDEQQHSVEGCLNQIHTYLTRPRLEMFCRDPKAMTLRLVAMIDFLKATEMHPPLQPAVENTWECLLSTLFNPPPPIWQVYETWGAFDRGHILHIYSALGIIIQRVWGRQSTSSPVPPSQTRIRTFLFKNPSKIHHAAEISLHLLSCRTAELKRIMTQRGPRPWPYRYFGVTHKRGLVPFWEFRGIAHWDFSSEWCTWLINAPPTLKLVSVLQRLVEQTFYAPETELDRPKLVKWLKSAGASVPLIELFEVDDGQRIEDDWCVFDFQKQTPIHSLVAGK